MRRRCSSYLLVTANLKAMVSGCHKECSVGSPSWNAARSFDWGPLRHSSTGGRNNLSRVGMMGGFDSQWFLHQVSVGCYSVRNTPVSNSHQSLAIRCNKATVILKRSWKNICSARKKLKGRTLRKPQTYLCSEVIRMWKYGSGSSTNENQFHVCAAWITSVSLSSHKGRAFYGLLKSTIGHKLGVLLLNKRPLF